ncbi:cell division protein FtsL [Ferrimicrobium sp.]|uniref:cell division protein FtsL n=1 Tax=Ferrimicrobium sp. TaxID=2926050 RepID=UPI002638F0FF|nr:cell division protein FtsL [Ferrimicrobium sp.]
MARVVALPQSPPRERPRRQRPELVLVEPTRRVAKSHTLRNIVIYLIAIALMGMVVLARIAIELEESSVGQLQTEITHAQRTQSDLQLEVAQLSSPERIMSYASAHLHLTLPNSVEVVSGTSTKNAVPLPQSEATNPSLPLPSGQVLSGN